MSPLIEMAGVIGLKQNQTTKLNTYTKTQTIHQVSSGKSHYLQNQGYPLYLLTKKYFKKQYPLTKKHYKILAIDTHSPINVLKTITTAPT